MPDFLGLGVDLGDFDSDSAESAVEDSRMKLNGSLKCGLPGNDCIS